jgi:hypothetical protein
VTAIGRGRILQAAQPECRVMILQPLPCTASRNLALGEGWRPGFVQLNDRRIWWTGRVAIGLRYEQAAPSHATSLMSGSRIERAVAEAPAPHSVAGTISRMLAERRGLAPESTLFQRIHLG